MRPCLGGAMALALCGCEVIVDAFPGSSNPGASADAGLAMSIDASNGLRPDAAAITPVPGLDASFPVPGPALRLQSQPSRAIATWTKRVSLA